MAQTFSFKGILTSSGWLEKGTITLDDQGNILSVLPGTDGNPINGYALPGFQNAHSHAFQYAMAGMAEFHSTASTPDSFWSWRNAMYDVALSVNPDQLEDIATMLYTEMARHGYTSVAEFHYLHHQPDGSGYDNPAEMGERLLRAAMNAGIRITLIPMFYQMGGFGQPAGHGQRRFLSKDIDEYYNLLDASRRIVSDYDNATLGMGIHSLRAVKPDEVIRLCGEFDNSMPFHIHIAEQLKEIEDCMAFHGQRPVEWLLNNCPVNEHYHLVHATHLADHELQGIVSAGAHVVLCPSTEGNLGDGLFRFREYQQLKGRWSVGTDSHIGLNPMEELRLLDYGQRLISHSRATFPDADNGDSAFNAIQHAWHGGRKAMGHSTGGFFEAGAPFDALIVSAGSPLIAASNLRDLTNTILYTSDVSQFMGTMVSGKWVRTTDSDNYLIISKFTNALEALRG